MISGFAQLGSKASGPVPNHEFSQAREHTTFTGGVDQVDRIAALARTNRVYPVPSSMRRLTLLSDFRTTSRLLFAIKTYAWMTSSMDSSGGTALGSCMSNRNGLLNSLITRY